MTGPPIAKRRARVGIFAGGRANGLGSVSRDIPVLGKLIPHRALAGQRRPAMSSAAPRASRTRRRRLQRPRVRSALIARRTPSCVGGTQLEQTPRRRRRSTAVQQHGTPNRSRHARSSVQPQRMHVDGSRASSEPTRGRPAPARGAAMDAGVRAGSMAGRSRIGPLDARDTRCARAPGRIEAPARARLVLVVRAVPALSNVARGTEGIGDGPKRRTQLPRLSGNLARRRRRIKGLRLRNCPGFRDLVARRRRPLADRARHETHGQQESV